MRKRKLRELLTGVLCAALFFTDVISVDIKSNAAEMEASWQTLIENSDAENEAETEDGEESSVSEPETESGEAEGEESSAEDVETEAETGMREEASSTENAETETKSDAETEIETGTETAAEIETETETEGVVVDGIEEGNAEERLAQLASAGDIASGSYGDIVWVIDANGKLTVEGTGEFTSNSSYYERRAPWYNDRLSIISAEINVSGITDISYMFNGCSNMTSLDVNNFDTSNVNRMISTFSRCAEMTSFDLSNFNTSNVTDMSYMFKNCISLTSLDLNNFDTSNVTNMGSMFEGCEALTSLNINNFDTSNVTDMGSMFMRCEALTSLDIDNFDTSNVTDMGRMFEGCEALTSLNINNFDTSNVTDMSSMFDGCYSLTSLDLSNFDTSNVTDMASMFGYCYSLTSLDLSNFDTSKVTAMWGMFERCEALTSLNLSNLATANVNDMSGMFRDCKGLTELDLGNFETGNVTNMSGMFSGCNNLLNLEIGNFDTQKVMNMNGMFSFCYNLKNINLNNFNILNVTDISYMFQACRSLENLDLSGFDVSNVTSITSLFSDCRNLKLIYTPYDLTFPVELPRNYGDVWYKSDGTEITELPQNLSYSIALGKNEIPEERIVQGVTISEAQIISKISVSEGKSAVCIIDGITGRAIEGATVWVGGTEQRYTSETGVAEFKQTGLKEINVSMEGYHSKKAKKTLVEGTCSVIILCPDTGEVRILSASLNVGGEDQDVLDNTSYLVNKDLEQITDGFDTELTLTVESAGSPTRYQLIQNSKVIQENATGVFIMSGKYVNSKDGDITYYTDELSAGYKVSVRVYGTGKKGESSGSGGGGTGFSIDAVDAKGTSSEIIKQTQELGIKVSEESAIVLNLKNKSDGSIELGDSLSITIPDSVPIFGGSNLDFGFQDKMPFKIKIENSGKVRISVNRNFDMSDSAEWEKIKKEYNSLAKRAKDSFGEKQSFGAGMFSIDASILGYGEGYWNDVDDSICVEVGFLVKAKGEAKYTFYCVPFYINVGGGVSVSVSGALTASLGEAGLVFNGGTLELNPSIYGNLEGGFGVDGLLSISAYGKATFSWLHRYADQYDRVTLNGNAKIKAKIAFLWESNVKELGDITWVIYDSKRKSNRSVGLYDQNSISYQDISGAEIISMDYLSKRKNGEEVCSSFDASGSGNPGSAPILEYAYENASPHLVHSGDNKLYLFYLDGVEGRSTQNQTALFYRFSEDNGMSWSSAIRVDNGANETADYDFDVASDETNIYCIWSDAGEVYGDEILSMDTAEAIAKVGKEMNLMLAVINKNTGAIETRVIQTENGDLQPQVVVGNDGTVYAAWFTNDVSSADGLFSADNQRNICYASSVENYTVHSAALAGEFYPMTMDAGLMGSEVYCAVGIDTDGNLNTQEDREIYVLNLTTGSALSQITVNQNIDSVPLFGTAAGQNLLFWYQNGNIVYTADGQTVEYVFDSEGLTSARVGQEFSIVEGGEGTAAIVWTSTSSVDDAGVDVYCTEFDGNTWSAAYCLGELDSEYTTKLSGFLSDSDMELVYTGSSYEGEELYSHISMFMPKERTNTSITWYSDAQETAGQVYPLHLNVENTGNVTVSSLSIASADGSIQEELTGLSIAPGTSQEITWEGLVLPSEMLEVYSCNLTIAAEGETDISDNEVTLSVGQPDFSVETYLDYSSGEQFASVTVTNNGILSSDAVLAVYADEGHTYKLYETELAAVAGGESVVSVYDLTAMDKTIQAFYFVVSDRNGVEVYADNNESILYSGKGIYKEYEDCLQVTHITAEKRQTVYEYGNVLYTDDLTVTAHYSNGTSQKISDYSTNADIIDMYVLGKKTLIVTYKDMTAELEMTVEPCMLDENTEVVLPYASCVYDGTAKEPIPTSVSIFGTELNLETDYTVTWNDNINAGTASVSVTGKNNYQGTITCNFDILKGFAPETETETIYVPGSTAQNERTWDISARFAVCGEIKDYKISVEEDDTVSSTQVLEGTPYMKEGLLVYSTAQGVANDFAVITVVISFVNYESVTQKIIVMLKDKEQVNISGISISGGVYNGKQISINGTASVTAQDGMEVTEEVTLSYVYGGTQADGSKYAYSEKPPINAGSYVLLVSVTDENENYMGRTQYAFTIARASAKITALDKNLVIGEDLLPETYDYQVIGLVKGDKLITEPSFKCAAANMTQKGTYPIIPYGADAGMNYFLSYGKGTLTVAEERIAYTIQFELMGHGSWVAPITCIKAGSLVEEPAQPMESGFVFEGWYKDRDFTMKWNFDTETVQENVTLYACWLIAADAAEGVRLSIQEIRNQTYTGSAIKPSVLVYSEDGKTLLRAGKDYTIKYNNNIEADTEAETDAGGTSQTGEEGDNGFTQNLAYVIITGKGNYTGTVYKNFHIDSVSIADSAGATAVGFKMKYAEQLVCDSKKAQKPFTSLKYKRNLKAGSDYEVTLTVLKAYDEEGNSLKSGTAVGGSGAAPAIPAGYWGTFQMTVMGIGNYSGTISKTIYVTDKNHLLKNAVITLGKNQKVMDYTGEAVTLSPAYYDVLTKRYYAVREDGTVSSEAEPNGDDIFTVKIGKEYLLYGKDYTISYTDNRAVGTASMTIKGIGNYMGIKSVTFRIKGTAFSAKNIALDNFRTTMTYTGKALTQNTVALSTNTSAKLVYGTDYSIRYKNNLKKGTATMIFTAKPESGYSGSFKRTFRITAAALKENVKVTAVNSAKDKIVYGDESINFAGEVTYSAEGAKLSDRIMLLSENSICLKEGTDYTISYANNKAVTTGSANTPPVMTIKGKGNYTGSMNIYFTISEAAMEGNENLTVMAAAKAYNEKKSADYQYKPQIKVMDGKKTLSAVKDYQVEYQNCTQSAVASYLKALQDGNLTEQELGQKKPCAVITAKEGSGYTGRMSVELTIYGTKLTGSTLYVVISEETVQTTYTGKQVQPEMTVYYGEAKAVKKAKKAGETDERILTDRQGNYGLVKLKGEENGIGDYTLIYGENVKAGKSKGSVTVTGRGLYGGSVKVKFTIHSKKIYNIL